MAEPYELNMNPAHPPPATHSPGRVRFLLGTS